MTVQSDGAQVCFYVMARLAVTISFLSDLTPLPPLKEMWYAPAIAAVVALAVAIILGPLVIGLLRRYARESIKSDSARLNELHAAKKETPTMGGVLIMLAFLCGSAAAGIESGRVFWTTILSALSLMTLGAADDWIKRMTERKGLTARQKLVGQILIGGLASIGICLTRGAAVSGPDSLPEVFIVWSTFVIIGTSNAVNLTDGLDGLASGCTIVTAIGLAFILMLSPPDANSIAHVRQSIVLLLALAGSCAGFLWFNRHPARVFMGDAGSLPIGGILAIAALSSRAELLLAICGGVFVIETLSVFAQVFCYRRTKTRILLCSPLHNHFVFKGTPERRIVRMFWLASCLFAILAAAIAQIVHF